MAGQGQACRNCATADVLRARIAELEAALRPFSDAVCRDNGDVTITHVEQVYYLRAKRLLSKGER